MCTLSLLPKSSGYSAWMNRDEAPERGASAQDLAQPLVDGLAQAYPVDPGSGGTWIGVNGSGLLLALLNDYPHPSPSKAPKSRGLIIPQALGQPSVAAARETVLHVDPGLYGPCVLVLAGPDQMTISLRSTPQGWDQQDHGRGAALFVSSGIDAAAARVQREKQFQVALAAGGQAIEAFHQSHEGGPGPLSVCMHRGTSRSVSLTHIEAGHAEVRLEYWPWPPCEILDRRPITAHLAP
jgi:hypothetical protein